MRQLLIDLRDFAYQAAPQSKDYRTVFYCLLAFYYAGIMVLISRCAEYMALCGIAYMHVIVLLMIELAFTLSIILVITYLSWRLLKVVELAPLPDQICPSEYRRKRCVAFCVVATGALFFIGALNVRFTPKQQTASMIQK